MKKIHEITKEIKVFASKDSVWNLLVDRFGEVNDFNPLIVESHALDNKQGQEGCERHCTIDNKRSVREMITATRGNKSFDVDIVDGGLPMMDKMAATFNMKEVGNGRTNIEMTMKFNTSPAFMARMIKGMMSKQLQTLMVGIKYHLETGGLVTKENIKSIMDGYHLLGEEANFEVLQLAPGLT